jgi:hypothetical protein
MDVAQHSPGAAASTTSSEDCNSFAAAIFVGADTVSVNAEETEPPEAVLTGEFCCAKLAGLTLRYDEDMTATRLKRGKTIPGVKLQCSNGR